MIGFSLGSLMSVDSAAAQTVGFSGFAALTLLGSISLYDSSSSCFEFSSELGHSSPGSHRNGGPSIQLSNSSGRAPLLSTSAGLQSDLMYRNACASSVSCISATLTETNGLNFLEHILIQVNTVCESIQNTDLQLVISANSRASLHVVYTLASERHPINSKRGNDFFFKGATNALIMSGIPR